MTAVVTTGTTTRRPAIPFFWWLAQLAHRDHRAPQRPQRSDYVPVDSAYIPSSTADLWRRSGPGYRR